MSKAGRWLFRLCCAVLRSVRPGWIVQNNWAFSQLGGMAMLNEWRNDPWSQRFPNDQKLRRRGFVLRHRPKGKPAVWSRGKALYIESEALKICKQEERYSKCAAP